MAIPIPRDPDVDLTERAAATGWPGTPSRPRSRTASTCCSRTASGSSCASVKHYLDRIPRTRRCASRSRRSSSRKATTPTRTTSSTTILREQGFEIDALPRSLQARSRRGSRSGCRPSSTSRAPPPPSTSPRSSPRARSARASSTRSHPDDAAAARVARRRGDRAQGGRVRRAPAGRPSYALRDRRARLRDRDARRVLGVGDARCCCARRSSAWRADAARARRRCARRRSDHPPRVPARHPRSTCAATFIRATTRTSASRRSGSRRTAMPYTEAA